MADIYIYPNTIRAVKVTGAQVREWLERSAGIYNQIDVAKGGEQDIVKRASHETDRPYMVVWTAASMDGYTSFGAAITKDGYKQTLSCPAPRAVLADLDVLTAAPA